MPLRTWVIVGVALALVGVSCSGSSDSEANMVIAQASDAMSARSFSVASTYPSSDQPGTLEYAPPDRIKYSNAPGNDAWKFNLIVGDRWYYSGRGEQWQEGVALAHIGMAFSDPRVLLRYAREPAVQDDKSLAGAEHYVVAMGVDASRLVNEVLRENVASQSTADEEGLVFWEELIGGMRLRLWIDKETFVVSQLELDYPPFPQDPGEESEDPPPAIITFDFEARVEITADPISWPAEEVRRLNDLVKERSGFIQRAVFAYNEEFGAYPPRADQDALSEYLYAWPPNPFTGQPMVQSAAYSPGDFCYEPGVDGEPYRFGTYGWDSSLGQTIPGCIPTE